VYGFLPAAWGKGYGTEILRGLIAFTFNTLGLPALRATVSVGNAASAHILLKCGFVRVEWEHDKETLLFTLVNDERYTPGEADDACVPTLP